MIKIIYEVGCNGMATRIVLMETIATRRAGHRTYDQTPRRTSTAVQRSDNKMDVCGCTKVREQGGYFRLYKGIAGQTQILGSTEEDHDVASYG